MSKKPNKSRGYLLTRVLVGLIGLTLAVVLHELFHIAMHWGRITHINFFVSPWSLVQIETVLPPGYDLEGEEIAAYGITLLVMFITTIIIFKIRDSEDNRSTGEILFPDDKDMQKFDLSEALDLPATGNTVKRKTSVRTTKPRRRRVSTAK